MKQLIISTVSTSLVAATMLGTGTHHRPITEVIYPLNRIQVTSPFGIRKHPLLSVTRLHAGVDLAAAAGTPIRAITNGFVVYAGQHGTYGNIITVRHNGGIVSLYAHCKSVSVQTGDEILAGQIIGRVGSSGLTNGPHLHLEIRVQGIPLDPETILTGLRKGVISHEPI